VLVYDHTAGRCAITGGYRYRGSRIPQIAGTYFYADLCTGEIWGATESGGVWTSGSPLFDTTLTISTFGEDESGEIYVVDLAGGAFYKLVDTRAATTTALAAAPNPSLAGQSVTFTATVTGSGATGTVAFMEGTTTLGTGPLSSGTAVFSTSALAVGSHTINAVYGGDASFAGSTSPPLTQTVNLTLSLLVTPATDMSSSGNQGGPFSPASFQYQLSATSGSVNYSISGLPIWLDASSTGGTLTTSPTTITFTVNTNANGLSFGIYDATISFSNTTNGQGNQTRTATLTADFGGIAPPATRTWVSGAGNDANDCTLTAPCQTFAGAIAKTATGGEINCLDPAGFGVVTITESISIVCDNVESGVLSASINGVIIDAPAGSIVTLKGQNIECAGTGVNGIELINAGIVLHVHKSRIGNCRGSPGNGILVANNSGTAKVEVADSYITDNIVGIEIKPSGTASAVVVINRVTAAANAVGFRGNGTATTGTISATITDSVSMSSSGAGINATAGTSPSVQVTLRRVSTVFNGTGINSSGANATIRFGDTVVTGNKTGTTATGTLSSYGTNFIKGNTVDGPDPGPIAPH
jgi:hypothetical protein